MGLKRDTDKKQLAHRLFSAVRYKGDLYCVKILCVEDRSKPYKLWNHVFNVTEIEIENNVTTAEPYDSATHETATSISVTKILKDFEKSYKKEKILF